MRLGRILILGLLTLSSTAFALSGDPAWMCKSGKEIKNLHSVAASWRFACALADSKVECWEAPFSTGDVTHIPKMTNPRQISAKGSGVCALADEGVLCWGNLLYPVPKLKNPTKVIAQNEAACALTYEGAKCWNYKGELPLPSEARQATDIAIGGYLGWNFGCMIVKDEVKCWGDNHYGQTNPPKLKNPKSVTAGEKHACAMDDEGIKCWGSRGEYWQTVVPKNLENPVQLATGDYYGNCALSSNHDISCWGAIQTLSNPAHVTQATQIAVGYDHMCAKSGDRLDCWGYAYSPYSSQMTCPIF